MGKITATFFIIAFFFISLVFGEDILTTKYYKDINNDGKAEFLVHDFIGGTGAYGILTVYNNKGQIIFKENVQGDPYLEDPSKHTLTPNPIFFKDLDKDGMVEILVGRQDHQDNTPNCDAPWKFIAHKWDGNKYTPLP